VYNLRVQTANTCQPATGPESVSQLCKPAIASSIPARAMQQQSVLGANNTLPLCTPAAMIWPAISGNTAVEVCSRLCSSAAVSLSLASQQQSGSGAAASCRLARQSFLAAKFRCALYAKLQRKSLAAPTLQSELVFTLPDTVSVRILHQLSPRLRAKPRRLRELTQR